MIQSARAGAPMRTRHYSAIIEGLLLAEHAGDVRRPG
jgi:hypothetical protein